MADRKKVLIVDDDAGDGDLTLRRLSALDAEVEFHDGPQGAVERIESGRYDLVLLDLNMPGISGLSILHALKADGCGARVLLYSAMEEAGLAEVAASAGVAWLNKSAARTVLIERVREMLAQNDV